MEYTIEEQRRLETARKRVQKMLGFYKHLGAYIIVNLCLLALKWFNLDSGQEFFTFSTFSMAFFWGIGLLFHAVSTFGTNIFLGSNWEDRKIREYMEKDREKNSKWQ